MATLFRAQLFHTPRNPFHDGAALEAYADGGLLVDGREILAVGDYQRLRSSYPRAITAHHGDEVILPGLIDTHVHYPQIPVIGAMGLRLLEWLERRTLPEEARLSEVGYARTQARTFLRQLARNGTTTALVFGAHFAGAMDIFFAEADRSSLRIAAGLVLSDRNLTEALHTTPRRALRESRALIERWHGHGHLRYAVTPRFSLSCSEAILEVCGDLLEGSSDLLFTTHLNENVSEISAVAELFPWASDYLETYERFGLLTPRSLFAHDVHVTDGELTRLAAARAGICHCPSSNMFIGSGLFPLRRHLRQRVNVSLGSDVGGGTGFSLLKEGLTAYEMQMLLQDDGYPLEPAHLLYLMTAAGAEVLGLNGVVGDLTPGKQADFVILKPPADSTLAAVLAHSPSEAASLAALVTLAREESISGVYVAGRQVWPPSG